MSDHIRLSLWFASQDRTQMLSRLAQAAETLPEEALERGVRQFSVTPLDWSEPALLEERVDGGTPVAVAVAQMVEFAQEDCACELELAWLLWEWGEEGWEQAPRPVTCSSLGPLFDEGAAAREAGHITVDFGLDEAFVGELAPWDAMTRGHLQANILQLLTFCHRVQRRLQPLRRRLWSDNEEDWTKKLEEKIERDRKR